MLEIMAPHPAKTMIHTSKQLRIANAANFSSFYQMPLRKPPTH